MTVLYLVFEGANTSLLYPRGAVCRSTNPVDRLGFAIVDAVSRTRYQGLLLYFAELSIMYQDHDAHKRRDIKYKTEKYGIPLSQVNQVSWSNHFVSAGATFK